MTDIRTPEQRALARRNYIVFCVAVVVSMTAFAIASLKFIGAI